MIRYLTGGESHGKALTAILEGIPSGLSLAMSDINRELARRQVGYGRGGRMAIEKDSVEITSGVRFGMTLGSPITMVISNKDWENWKEVMNTGVRGQGSGVRGQV
ncbi:MAG: chorismate synthase, partial [Deltaproteobacteria bacterium]|nr:chorismate synthase [Deltaproteobacteria bacterium]